MKNASSPYAPQETWIALFLVTAGCFLRVLPHPENFTPIVAIALLAGAVLPPALALTVPVLAMIASDLWIGHHDLFWVTWGTFAAVVLIGRALGRSPGALRSVLGSLAGSTVFFLTSNLAVFLFQDMYPRTYAGLVECFTMALPFFRNSVLGDLFYTAAFFCVWALARRAVSPAASR